MTRRLDIESKDEIGELCHWFNLFVDNIQSILIELRDNAITLSSSSEPVDQDNEEEEDEPHSHSKRSRGPLASSGGGDDDDAAVAPLATAAETAVWASLM